MWKISGVKYVGDERTTILGGTKNEMSYHSIGDELGPAGSQYLTYVRGRGGLLLSDLGEVPGGPRDRAVHVQGAGLESETDYWWYDEGGECTIIIKDGRFECVGEDNSVIGALVPEQYIQYTGRSLNSLCVTIPSSTPDERARPYPRSGPYWFRLPDGTRPWMDLLDDGDVIKLQAASQKFLTTDGDRVTDGAVTQQDGADIDVEKTREGVYLRINDTYVRVADDGTLYADADRGEATLLRVVATSMGTVRLETSEGTYIRVATDDRDHFETVLKADTTAYNDPTTTFDLVLKGKTVSELEAQMGVSLSADESVTCLKEKMLVAWNLFSGLFRIMGLTSWGQRKKEELQEALWVLIERHPRVKQLIEEIAETASAANWHIPAASLLNLINEMWSTGLLKKAVKLWFGTGWIAFGRVFLTVVNWAAWLFENFTGYGTAVAWTQSIAGWSLWTLNMGNACYELYKCEHSGV